MFIVAGGTKGKEIEKYNPEEELVQEENIILAREVRSVNRGIFGFYRQISEQKT